MDLADTEDRPQRVAAAAGTANAFQTLRVGPVLGREFIPEDERSGAEPIVMLGYRLWKERYGGGRRSNRSPERPAADRRRRDA